MSLIEEENNRIYWAFSRDSTIGQILLDLHSLQNDHVYNVDKERGEKISIEIEDDEITIWKLTYDPDRPRSAKKRKLLDCHMPPCGPY